MGKSRIWGGMKKKSNWYASVTRSVRHIFRGTNAGAGEDACPRHPCQRFNSGGHALVLLRQDDMEFQVFAGVNDKLASRLRKEGFRVRLYIPYGDMVSILLEGLALLGHLPRGAQETFADVGGGILAASSLG